MINNPYISMILDVPHLLTTPEIQRVWKGRWHEYFGNNHPRVLEIGTGLGNYFAGEVSNHPEKNFIGLEIKYKRVYMTTKKSTKVATTNNFVILKAFGQDIDKIFAPEELQEIIIFFPDPWWNKSRQQKHKLMQDEFIKKMYSSLSEGGTLSFKTDHRGYFEEVVEMLERHGGWEIEILSFDYEADTKRLTEFETMYRAERLPIHFLVVSKIET